MIAGHDRANNAHARNTSNVSDDVMKLDVHLHQRLLHMLNVGRRVFDQPLAMAQVRAQSHDTVARPKAPAHQPILVELLQPLGVVDVGLAAGHVLDVARVHQQHVKPACLENLEYWNPVHAGGFHGDGGDADLFEPMRQAVEIAAEGAEGPNRPCVAIARHRDDVKCRADVDAGRQSGLTVESCPEDFPPLLLLPDMFTPPG